MGFGANSDHFGTSEDLHRRPGGILGAKLAFFLALKSTKIASNWVKMHYISLADPCRMFGGVLYILGATMDAVRLFSQ